MAVSYVGAKRAQPLTPEGSSARQASPGTRGQRVFQPSAMWVPDLATGLACELRARPAGTDV
eukprot:6016029-Prymnesium_polylepis.3